MARKILHVLAGMNRGGVETWLMRALRVIDRDQFKFEFFANDNREADYDREIRELGGSIYYCRGRVRNPIEYAREFRRVLIQQGPFDVVHSHLYLYSGFVMRLAAQAGVPVRIAHIHTAPVQHGFNLQRLLYRQLMTKWVNRYSTHCIAVSQSCADAFLGSHPQRPAQVVYCGIDFTPFLKREATAVAKLRLSIPEHSTVIGHVGRFTPVKNHAFLLRIFDCFLRHQPNARLLLVGDGPLLPSIRADAEARGLADRCSFAGLQDTVLPFLSAMDAFVFPSLHEGLPISVLEAQASGVPVVASAHLTNEMEMVPGFVRRVALEAGPDAWASAVEQSLEDRLKFGNNQAAVAQKSKFTLNASVQALVRIYGGDQSTKT